MSTNIAHFSAGCRGVHVISHVYLISIYYISITEIYSEMLISNRNLQIYQLPHFTRTIAAMYTHMAAHKYVAHVVVHHKVTQGQGIEKG